MRTWLAISTCLTIALAHAAPAHSQGLTMDSLWPNDNGDEWRYDQHYEDLINALVVDNQVRIFFDGTTVVPDCLPAQYLREEVVAGPSPKQMALESLVPDPFLREVWVARPDQCEKILRAVTDSPCPEDSPCPCHASS